MVTEHDVFAVPIKDKYLVHAPLHDFTALVNAAAVRQIQAGLLSDTASVHQALQPIVNRLRSTSDAAPQARSGKITSPFFLGLIPTRGCNMGCPYCDFSAPKTSSESMDLNLARESINMYMDIMAENGHKEAEVHFFGGEPFYAEDVVHFVVAYATMRAQELGLHVRFEATSNGLYNSTRANWVADYFDTVVLSLDGPDYIQDHNRPGLNGKSVFEAVTRTAKIFSERSIELILRTCVTSDSVHLLPEMAEWFARDFRPSTWCVETLTESPLNEAAGLNLPDPWEFAKYFDIAARILEPYGIELVNSTTDVRQIQHTFCPVSRDAMIVSPDGSVDACYLLKKDWSRNGLNMRYGHIHVPGVTEPQGDLPKYQNSGFISLDSIGVSNGVATLATEATLEIDEEALAGIRDLNVYNRSLCDDCMCRYHCAGGCHVNHDTSRKPGDFDNLCVHTPDKSGGLKKPMLTSLSHAERQRLR